MEFNFLGGIKESWEGLSVVTDISTSRAEFIVHLTLKIISGQDVKTSVFTISLS